MNTINKIISLDSTILTTSPVILNRLDLLVSQPIEHIRSTRMYGQNRIIHIPTKTTIMSLRQLLDLIHVSLHQCQNMVRFNPWEINGTSAKYITTLSILDPINSFPVQSDIDFRIVASPLHPDMESGDPAHNFNTLCDLANNISASIIPLLHSHLIQSGITPAIAHWLTQYFTPKVKSDFSTRTVFLTLEIPQKTLPTRIPDTDDQVYIQFPRKIDISVVMTNSRYGVSILDSTSVSTLGLVFCRYSHAEREYAIRTNAVIVHQPSEVLRLFSRIALYIYKGYRLLSWDLVTQALIGLYDELDGLQSPGDIGHFFKKLSHYLETHIGATPADQTRYTQICLTLCHLGTSWPNHQSFFNQLISHIYKNKPSLRVLDNASTISFGSTNQFNATHLLPVSLPSFRLQVEEFSTFIGQDHQSLHDLGNGYLRALRLSLMLYSDSPYSPSAIHEARSAIPIPPCSPSDFFARLFQEIAECSLHACSQQDSASLALLRHLIPQLNPQFYLSNSDSPFSVWGTILDQFQHIANHTYLAENPWMSRLQLIGDFFQSPLFKTLRDSESNFISVVQTCCAIPLPHSNGLVGSEASKARLIDSLSISDQDSIQMVELKLYLIRQISSEFPKIWQVRPPSKRTKSTENRSLETRQLQISMNPNLLSEPGILAHFISLRVMALTDVIPIPEYPFRHLSAPSLRAITAQSLPIPPELFKDILDDPTTWGRSLLLNDALAWPPELERAVVEHISSHLDQWTDCLGKLHTQLTHHTNPSDVDQTIIVDLWIQGFKQWIQTHPVLLSDPAQLRAMRVLFQQLKPMIVIWLDSPDYWRSIGITHDWAAHWIGVIGNVLLSDTVIEKSEDREDPTTQSAILWLFFNFIHRHAPTHMPCLPNPLTLTALLSTVLRLPFNQTPLMLDKLRLVDTLLADHHDAIKWGSEPRSGRKSKTETTALSLPLVELTVPNIDVLPEDIQIALIRLKSHSQAIKLMNDTPHYSGMTISLVHVLGNQSEISPHLFGFFLTLATQHPELIEVWVRNSEHWPTEFAHQIQALVATHFSKWHTLLLTLISKSTSDHQRNTLLELWHRALLTQSNKSIQQQYLETAIPILLSAPPPCFNLLEPYLLTPLQPILTPPLRGKIARHYLTTRPQSEPTTTLAWMQQLGLTPTQIFNACLDYYRSQKQLSRFVDYLPHFTSDSPLLDPELCEHIQNTSAVISELIDSGISGQAHVFQFLNLLDLDCSNLSKNTIRLLISTTVNLEVSVPEPLLSRIVDRIPTDLSACQKPKITAADTLHLTTVLTWMIQHYPNQAWHDIDPAVFQRVLSASIESENDIVPILQALMPISSDNSPAYIYPKLRIALHCYNYIPTEILEIILTFIQSLSHSVITLQEYIELLKILVKQNVRRNDIYVQALAHGCMKHILTTHPDSIEHHIQTIVDITHPNIIVLEHIGVGLLANMNTQLSDRLAAERCVTYLADTAARSAKGNISSLLARLLINLYYHIDISIEDRLDYYLNFFNRYPLKLESQLDLADLFFLHIAQKIKEEVELSDAVLNQFDLLVSRHLAHSHRVTLLSNASVFSDPNLTPRNREKLARYYLSTLKDHLPDFFSNPAHDVSSIPDLTPILYSIIQWAHEFQALFSTSEWIQCILLATFPTYSGVRIDTLEEYQAHLGQLSQLTQMELRYLSQHLDPTDLSKLTRINLNIMGMLFRHMCAIEDSETLMPLPEGETQIHLVGWMLRQVAHITPINLFNRLDLIGSSQNFIGPIDYVAGIFYNQPIWWPDLFENPATMTALGSELLAFPSLSTETLTLMAELGAYLYLIPSVIQFSKKSVDSQNLGKLLLDVLSCERVTQAGNSPILTLIREYTGQFSSPAFRLAAISHLIRTHSLTNSGCTAPFTWIKLHTESLIHVHCDPPTDPGTKARLLTDIQTNVSRLLNSQIGTTQLAICMFESLIYDEEINQYHKQVLPKSLPLKKTFSVIDKTPFNVPELEIVIEKLQAYHLLESAQDRNHANTLVGSMFQLHRCIFQAFNTHLKSPLVLKHTPTIHAIELLLDTQMPALSDPNHLILNIRLFITQFRGLPVSGILFNLVLASIRNALMVLAIVKTAYSPQDNYWNLISGLLYVITQLNASQPDLITENFYQLDIIESLLNQNATQYRIDSVPLISFSTASLLPLDDRKKIITAISAWEYHRTSYPCFYTPYLSRLKKSLLLLP